MAENAKKKELEAMSQFKDNDETLIARMRAGEGEALDILLMRYKQLARQRAQKYYMAGADNEDLQQEAMIGLYKAICDFKIDGGASFRTFAVLCIDRQLASAIKAASRKKHGPLNDYVSLQQTRFEQDSEHSILELLDDETQEDPAEMLAEKENSQLLRMALEEELSSFEKVVLNHYLEGAEYQEIAHKLKKPAKSIDNALQRIKQKARNVANHMVAEDC